ncbi:hypothetical protein J0X00_04665 [Vibrio sp. ABG19]|nr:hypothetical protein [Vibrio sp. ABG19]WGY45913.1 hypothetical protein J0X00_04665 [Vibrio sp. ABG19]
MAITIRDTEQHDKMLSDLKELTRIPTMSKSLIKGGYLALQYHDLYQRERSENERLRDELRSLRNRVDGFVSAFDALKTE